MRHPIATSRKQGWVLLQLNIAVYSIVDGHNSMKDMHSFALLQVSIFDELVSWKYLSTYIAWDFFLFICFIWWQLVSVNLFFPVGLVLCLINTGEIYKNSTSTMIVFFHLTNLIIKSTCNVLNIAYNSYG